MEWDGNVIVCAACPGETGRSLKPAEHLLNALLAILADLVARMACRPIVDRRHAGLTSLAQMTIEGDMHGDTVLAAQRMDESAAVERSG